MSILEGKYPRNSVYRSALIARLRADVAAGKIKSEGQFKSPQIEPTLKRDIESGVDHPEFKHFLDESNRAQRAAASALGLLDDAEFGRLNERVRYDLLIERYRGSLVADGFTLDSHRKTGLVFRRLTSNQRWAFLWRN